MTRDEWVFQECASNITTNKAKSRVKRNREDHVELAASRRCVSLGREVHKDWAISRLYEYSIFKDYCYEYN